MSNEKQELLKPSKLVSFPLFSPFFLKALVSYCPTGWQMQCSVMLLRPNAGTRLLTKDHQPMSDLQGKNVSDFQQSRVLIIGTRSEMATGGEAFP